MKDSDKNNNENRLIANKISVVVTTLPNEQISSQIARELIELKLAFCVNIVPIYNSIYHWQGKIDCSKEYYLVAKTFYDFSVDCLTKIKDLHPYTVPFLIKFEVDQYNHDYHQWAADYLLPAKF